MTIQQAQEMSRGQLEAYCRRLGYDPDIDDTDADLVAMIVTRTQGE